MNEGDNESHKVFYIHKSRDIEDLYFKVQEWLEENYNFDSSRQSFILIYKNQILKRNLSLKEAGIQSHTKVYVLIED